MPNDRLAMAAYAAHCDAVHHPLDEWHELSPDAKDMWRAVADAVVMAFGTKADEQPTSEPVKT